VSSSNLIRSALHTRYDEIIRQTTAVTHRQTLAVFCSTKYVAIAKGRLGMLVIRAAQLVQKPTRKAQKLVSPLHTDVVPRTLATQAWSKP
jgi:hypothetical protein